MNTSKLSLPLVLALLVAGSILGSAAWPSAAAEAQRATAQQPGQGRAPIPGLSRQPSEAAAKMLFDPGDTVLLEVKQKDSMGGFTMLSGSIKKADGTRVMNVEFSVAWRTPSQ